MSTPLESLRPNQFLGRLGRLSREQGRPTAELYTLYALERVLDRLCRTQYRDDFVLKGGILLAAHRLRRPTSDIDMQAVGFTLDAEHVRAVVAAIAAVPAADGLELDLDSLTVAQIREDDDYTGLRVTVRHVTLHGRGVPAGIKLDISTGDPIWPAPQIVELPGLLGGTITISGHPLPTVIAEKTVTMLQRGTQSTRWRDLVDVRSLARRYEFLAADLWAAGVAVAEHRGVVIGPVAHVTAGYGAVGQQKWAAWVRKLDLGGTTQSLLDDQVADIARFIDPVYTRSATAASRWDPAAYAWGP